MAWFFTDSIVNTEKYSLFGESAKHISKVLRMNRGEEITLVDPEKMQCRCTISDISADCVTLDVLEKVSCQNEPSVEVTLYQALPKGDKMELIIQKCVELGVSKIVPVISARCISRPDRKTLEKKQARWQKIALQAAMQSRRGIVPEVCQCISFENAVKQSAENDKTIIFYEMGGEAVGEILTDTDKKIGIFIGSEGGFEQGEVDSVLEQGGKAATLGKRILRCETAPLAAMSIIMYQTGNF